MTGSMGRERVQGSLASLASASGFPWTKRVMFNIGHDLGGICAAENRVDS